MIYEKYLIAPPTEREREIVKRMDDTCLYYEFEHFTGEKLFDVAPQATVLPEYRECRCGKWKKSSWHCLRN